MRVVIDTNIFIFGVMGSNDLSLERACKKILSAVQAKEIVPVMNSSALKEFIVTTSSKAYQLQGRKSSQFMVMFSELAAMSEQINQSISVWNPRWIYHAPDKMFIECASDGNVSYIVSDDYSLKRFIQWNLSQGHHEAVATVEERGIHFLSPEDFAAHVLN